MNILQELYKNPVICLIVAIPAGTLLAGAWMIRSTAQHNPVVVEPSSVSRVAQMQTEDNRMDLYAAEHQLSALIQREAANKWRSSAKLQAGSALDLFLVHISNPDKDRKLRMPASGTFSVPLDSPDQYRFVLQAQDQQWRLKGRWDARCSCVHFEPAFSTD
jgi:hypothetical protein